MCAGAGSEAENTDSLSFMGMKHIGLAHIIESDSNGYGPKKGIHSFSITDPDDWMALKPSAPL